MGKAKAKIKQSVDNAKDAYEIAKDAVEEAAGRDPKRHKALMAEAMKLTRLGYKQDPTVRVPVQLREFIKFTEATIRREFMATSTDADVPTRIIFTMNAPGWTSEGIAAKVLADVGSTAPVAQEDEVTFCVTVRGDRANAEVSEALDAHPAVVSVSYEVDDDGLVVKIDNDGVNARVDYGTQEYMVWRTEEDAEAAARERVIEDLKENPEYFNQSFIEGHIDMKKLADLVEKDAQEDGYIDDLDRADLRSVAKQYNIDMEDDEGEDRDEDTVREEIRHAYASDMAKDPMSRLEDMLGREEAVKWAIEHAGIDYEAAADQAIRGDGWVHYVNSYDGDYINSPVLDYVIYRTN